MSRHSKKRLLWTGFVLAMLGLLPTAPRPAWAGLAALDAFHIGRYHLANGQREQALESFNDALRLNPQFVQAYVARGKLYAELGQYESALMDLNFALRLQPTHVEAFAYRGYALLSLGQAQKAIPDLDMALRIDPSYARVHFLRGQAMQLLGDQQAAAASIARARRLDPTLDVSQVVTADADGVRADGGLQLTGGAGPLRTPVSAELMPAESPPRSVDPKYVGRLVPFQDHPDLVDVLPPAMSRDLDLSPVIKSPDYGLPSAVTTNGERHPRILTPPQTSQVSPTPQLPDITSDVPPDEFQKPLDLAYSTKPIDRNLPGSQERIAAEKVAVQPGTSSLDAAGGGLVLSPPSATAVTTSSDELSARGEQVLGLPAAPQVESDDSSSVPENVVVRVPSPAVEASGTKILPVPQIVVTLPETISTSESQDEILVSTPPVATLSPVTSARPSLPSAIAEATMSGDLSERGEQVVGLPSAPPADSENSSSVSENVVIHMPSPTEETPGSKIVPVPQVVATSPEPMTASEPQDEIFASTPPVATSSPVIAARPNLPHATSEQASRQEPSAFDVAPEHQPAEAVVASQPEDEIALSLPAEASTIPSVVIRPIPQNADADRRTVRETPAGEIESGRKPADVAATALEPHGRHIPAFGPQIFVVPPETDDGGVQDARGSNNGYVRIPASAILRGVSPNGCEMPERPSSMESDRRVQAAVEAARENTAWDNPAAVVNAAGEVEASTTEASQRLGSFMLPEKPSSIESDRRLQAAVEAARLSAASGDIMAVVEDEGDVPEPAVVQYEPTAEQLEQSKAVYRRGTQCEAEGKVAEALAAYQDAVKLNPNDAEILCRRGHLLMEGLRTAEALADFEKVIAVAPGLSSGYFGRAHVRYVTEQYLDAVYDYSIALRFDDQHAQAFIERGHCYDLLGRVAEAKADRRAALDLDPSLAKNGPKYAMGTRVEPIPTAVMPGATAYAGDDEEVVPTTASNTSSKLGNQAIATDDGASIDTDQSTPGESAFENLFTPPMPYVDEASRGASANLDSPASDKSIAKEPVDDADLKRLNDEISQFPGDKDRYFRRARAYCALGQLQAALDDLNTCLRFDAAHLEAIKLRAEVQSKLQNSAGAAADLTTALRQTPDDVALLLNRAASLAENGDVRAALADLDRVIALDPQNRSAYVERSRLHAERGAFTEAQADRDRAIRLGSQAR